MDNLLTVAFEAHSQEENHHRRYQITVGRDLLDDWTVAILYGRTGQEKRYASPKAEEMRAIIRDRLRRRFSAPKQIGCSYRLAAFSAARAESSARQSMDHAELLARSSQRDTDIALAADCHLQLAV